MRLIRLTQCYRAMVDDDMYEELSRYNWCAHVKRDENGSVRMVYAKRTIGSIKSKSGQTTLFMHTFLTGSRVGEQVDHFPEQCGLNNQLVNITSGTPSANCNTHRKRQDNTSGYVGVTWNKKRSRWQTGVTINGERTHLGLFDCKNDAARTYNLAKRMYAGPRATLNVINEVV